MCLDTVTRVKEKQGVGYKVFNWDAWRHLVPRWQGLTTKRFPVGKWINEKDWRGGWATNLMIKSSDCKQYEAGFHLYKEAKSIFGRKVRFRKACAEGKQGGRQVIVAKEIFIEKLR